MKQIRKRLTYANVMSSIAVFFVLGGGAAFAANELAKNSVGAKQLKKNAVTSAKIKKNAVTTAKIRNGAVTGAKIDSSTLAQVPSAAHATSADNLAGQTSYSVKLSPGQEQTIVTHGAVSIIARCDSAAGNDRIALLGATTAPGSLMLGSDYYLGNGAFLNPDTHYEDRILESAELSTGDSGSVYEIDSGWIMDPSGKTLSYNMEGTALTLNYAGAVCMATGVVNAIG